MDERFIDIVVEIPKGSRNKYEYDEERRVIRLDRRLLSAMNYPADYGYVPETRAEDGDPLDALVLVDDPTFPGCWVKARPIGIFWMEDEKGPDAKLICLPDDPSWKDVADIDDLSDAMRAEIKHFFDVYKIIEPDKSSSTKGFEGPDAAWREIKAALERRAAERNQ